MWRLTIFKRRRQGFALIFVILIALAMIIPAMMIASSAAPRRKAVTGEAVSDRVLTLADSTVDHIVNKINTFPFTFTTPTIIDEDGNLDTATKEAEDYLISYYISQLNGGVPDANDPTGSYSLISGYVSTYLYNLKTQQYWAVWDDTNHKIANVSAVGPDGDIAQTGKIKNLSTGAITSLPFTNIDTDYKTDNLWVEIDTNTKYWPGEPDKWDIKTTAYLLSRPKIQRTIEAVASRGKVSASTGEYANGSWFTHNTTTTTVTHSFADYSGLYHTKVYFGKFETTRGPIRSDANLYMGGWAHDPVFANNRVYDEAVDDGWRHDGRFGPDKKRLRWARNNGYATSGYPAADWANVDNALYGTNPVRNPTDPNGGIQDKALPDYYVNGDATVVFSVEDGTGYVTINGNKLPMPPNGAIFVEGTATVSGTVKGQCSVGAKWINIGGNIIYNTPPRLDRNEPIPANPDLLGLISHNDITIPAATFDANHHLEIDAAMISGSGSFGIDPHTSWHYIDPSGTYEAWWNGCQAMWNTSNAPAINLGWGRVRGYEIQHTNFDWNLRDYGAPPFYPVTSTEEQTDIIDHYPIVTDTTILSVLHSLTKSDLTPTGDPNYPYKYVYNGVTYYYGSTFNWGATAHMNNTSLYRIAWKEQIAEPVKP